MGTAYKNFWSLNTDEAVVTGLLRDQTSKDVEVLLPANAQMKDVDLVLMNMKTKKTITIQVKGSRAFEPRKSEVVKYGDGSAGWFFFHKDVIHESTADFFIFLVYVLEEDKKRGRRQITPHTITIPTVKLKKLCTKNKKVGKGDRYNIYIWVNPKTKDAFEFRDKVFSLRDYLDKSGIQVLNHSLK